jgi:uncharacterized membrane protein
MNDESHDITSSQLNQLLLLLSAFVLAMGLLSAYAWLQLPNDIRIPVHWGINGQADRYGGKAQGLLMLPAITFLTCLLFRVIPIFKPRRRNLLRSLTAYRMTSLSVCLLMFGLHAALIGSLLGVFEFNIMNIVSLLVALLLIVIGNYLGKVRSNFMFGIRTPWTLSSDLSWNKTHRLGGKLFVLSGIVGLAGHVLPLDKPLLLTLGTLIAAVILLVVYSYLVWRDDPGKQTQM